MFTDYIEKFKSIIKNTEVTNDSGTLIEINDAFNSINEYLKELVKNNGTVYLVGNGGSSGIISHSSVDFLNACKIKAIPLTDNSQLTCFANDYGYEQVFSKPLEILLGEHDLLIAVSSSGSSQNIINAAKVALQKKTRILTFSGFKSNNPLRELGNFNLWLNSIDYCIIEIGHALLLHLVTDNYSIQIKK